VGRDYIYTPPPPRFFPLGPPFFFAPPPTPPPRVPPPPPPPPLPLHLLVFSPTFPPPRFIDAVTAAGWRALGCEDLKALVTDTAGSGLLLLLDVRDREDYMVSWNTAVPLEVTHH